MDSDKVYQLYYKDNNPIQPIRGFCATVENDCVIRKAAEALGVEPATISKQIKALERKLGVILLENKDNSDRKGSKLKLTREGEKFYEKARPIIIDLDKLFLEYSHEMDIINESSLNIATTSFMVQKLIDSISSFKKTIKNSNSKNIGIIATSQEDGIKMLLDKKIDIFISHREEAVKLPYNIEFIKLTEYIPYLVLYKGHPLENVKSEDITVDDLINSGLGFNYEEVTINTLKGLIDDYNIKSKAVISASINNLEIQKSFIRNQMCVCIIFNIFLNKEDSKYFIFKNMKKLLSSGSYGYYVLKNNKKIFLQNFIDFIKKEKNIIFDNSYLD